MSRSNRLGGLAVVLLLLAVLAPSAVVAEPAEASAREAPAGFFAVFSQWIGFVLGKGPAWDGPEGRPTREGVQRAAPGRSPTAFTKEGPCEDPLGSPSQGSGSCAASGLAGAAPADDPRG